MTKHTPTLGPGVSIDVDRLLVSRLLIQANSGGGKSWTIRRLLEQTHGRCQQIVIDVEGEFHTLREHFDYVLAGKGGDCPADLRSAELLARRLLELNVSAIVDIYELGTQRTAFVARFLGALMAAPRELWHPALVVVDEAHLFCPEKGRGEAESTAAVIDLMTRGRKRGFCGVLATQRISKLNKDAAAEANNKLIGRSALDVDMKRSAEELGLTGRDEVQRLRKLGAGQFFAFGPAISTSVVEVTIGPVETSHPEAGEKAPPPTPPRAKIQKVLGELADLPAEAEAEAKTAGELRAKVKQLEAEAREAKRAQPQSPKVETKTVEKAVIKEAQLQRVGVLIEQGERIVKLVEDAGRRNLAAMDGANTKGIALADKIAAELAQLRAAIASTKAQPTAHQFAPNRAQREVGASRVSSRVPNAGSGVAAGETAPSRGDTSLTGPQRALLTALAWWAAMGHTSPTRAQLAGKAGWKARGSNLRNRLSELSAAGLVEYPREGEVALTAAGAAAAPSPNTSDTLVESIRGSLTGPQCVVFDELLAHGQRGRDTLAEALKWEPGGSNLRNRLSELSAMELVDYPSKGSVVLQGWVTA